MTKWIVCQLVILFLSNFFVYTLHLFLSLCVLFSACLFFVSPTTISLSFFRLFFFFNFLVPLFSEQPPGPCHSELFLVSLLPCSLPNMPIVFFIFKYLLLSSCFSSREYIVTWIKNVFLFLYCFLCLFCSTVLLYVFFLMNIFFKPLWSFFSLPQFKTFNLLADCNVLHNFLSRLLNFYFLFVICYYHPVSKSWWKYNNNVI